jgi:hypothetical protein
MPNIRKWPSVSHLPMLPYISELYMKNPAEAGIPQAALRFTVRSVAVR